MNQWSADNPLEPRPDLSSPGMQQRGRLNLVTFAGRVSMLLHSLVGRKPELQMDLSDEVTEARIDERLADLLCLDLYFRALTMPEEGGLILLEAFQVHLDDSHPKVLLGNCRAGSYVILSMSDTFPEIDLDEAKLIEGEHPGPTSAPRQNLVSLVNQVRSHGGHLHVYGAPQRGRQLEVYLSIGPTARSKD